MHRACALAVIAIAACASDEPAPIPVDPDDVDGDGIANTDDNCPTTRNLAQDDEDGDAVGDACDVCPTVADPNQLDTGEIAAMQFGDGVGDFCDPRPSRDGDDLAGFHPFVTDTSADWSGDGWAIGAGVARTVSTASWFHRQVVRGDNLYVQANVPLLIWLAAGEVRVIADGTEGLACVVEHDRDGDGFDELSLLQAGTRLDSEGLGVAVTGPVVITAWRSINAQREMTYICRVELPDRLRHELRVDNLEELAVGVYAIESRGAITDVGSIAVYVSPVSPCLASKGERACENDGSSAATITPAVAR